MKDNWNFKMVLETIDLISAALDNPPGFYIAYSKINNLSIPELQIAVNLFVAYDFYKTTDFDKIKASADNCDSAIINIMGRYIPDEIVNELNKYEYQSSDYRHYEYELVYGKEWPNKFTEHLIKISNNETATSLLDYCINIGKYNPDYWEKVFSRLNIKYVSDKYLFEGL
jgi:hypothetical protein